MFDVAGGADELVDFGFALDAGAIVRCASAVGDRGYKKTLSQPFVMLYVIHV